MQKVRAYFKKIFFFSGVVVAFVLLAGVGLTLVITHLKSARNSDRVVLLKKTFLNDSNSVNTFAFHNSVTGDTWVYHVSMAEQIDPDLSTQTASQKFGLLISKILTLPQPIDFSRSAFNADSSESVPFSKDLLQESLGQAVFSSKPLDNSFWEYWWWWWHIRSRSSTQYKTQYFDSLESWQAYAPERDFQLSTQPCSIAVVNTTGVTGLATDVGAILERSGLFVARLTNNQSNTSHSLILTKNLEECQEVIDAVSILTPNSTEVAIDEAAATRYRARVVLLVGKDLIPVENNYHEMSEENDDRNE